ncbi:hypothetical protein DD237_007441 [Peronospora effusa]|nr:hypothetical protein DD237_007441 [Peronospora effusa]
MHWYRAPPNVSLHHFAKYKGALSVKLCFVLGTGKGSTLNGAGVEFPPPLTAVSDLTTSSDCCE